MLLNSPYYLCQSFKQKVQPCSRLYNLKTVPKNFWVTSNKSFLFCDLQNHQTSIKQFQYVSEQIVDSQQPINEFKPIQQDKNQITTVEMIEGTYTSYGFNDESVLFLNRNGDFYYYNLINKNVFKAEKQHPGLYSDAQVLSLQGYYLTCGGCVKNPITGTSQRIIKIWKINQDNDTLQLRGRINTGHSKSVENSFLVNQKVITLSCDKTIRISNLATESVEKLITVNQDLFAGTNIDYNTIIVGGIGKQMKIFDLRTSRLLMKHIQIPSDLIQITKIVRFNDNNLLLSNINELFAVDLRIMKLRELGKYEGERISEITIINKQNFIIGNREKTMQIWKAS